MTKGGRGLYNRGKTAYAEVREQTLLRQGQTVLSRYSLGEEGIAVAGDQELAEAGTTR